MVSAISQAAVVTATAELANKSSGSAVQNQKGAMESEVAEQVSSRPDDAIQAPKYLKTGKENANAAGRMLNQGEVRKNEVKDGEMRTKVYDRKGKLLRVIPPGYIPVGEKRFDLTV